MATALTFLDILLVLVGLYLVKQLLLARKHGLPLPPGPKGLPLIGNVRDMPSTHEWITFAQWRDQYGKYNSVLVAVSIVNDIWRAGDIVSLTLFGQSMIILNSPKLAIELLDKKSPTYSDRPQINFGGEMVGWKNSLALLPYGERFREYRRFFHRLIGSKTQVQKFHSLIELETRKFLRNVLQSSDSVEDHIRQ